MIPCKPMATRLILFILSLFGFLSINLFAQTDGQTLFISKCQQCHIMGKDGTGPNLEGVEERWGGDRAKLSVWIKNSPKMIASGDPKAVEVSNLKPTIMTAFEGSITDAEIETVLNYVKDWKPVVIPTTTPGGESKDSSQNAIIFGIISLILALIAMILMHVNSNLKKMSDDAEGIQRPEPVPFFRNKVYITMAAILFFIVGGYYATKGAIGLGRQKGYQPVQPIYYSHKVHAGINQISCLYCHGAAWESRHAAIPSVNVCMNCHKTITTYEKGPKLYDESGDEVNGSNEIAKLHEYAGFDPKNPTQWDPSKAKQIEWVKIHNLPDYVYFNHSQHVRAGNVQCQTCHGDITQMDEVKQESELSMGWCINCHRETKVNFNYDNTKGNKFYSIYEKFHNDFKSGKMDSITVKDIGGLECQKCHY